MSDLPLISVIVPVYNVEKYLNRCVESIVGQTYDNLEIFLMDDGSPDESGTICDIWAKKDSRIRVIHQANSGAGAARNAALKLAQGELIAFVDSDDYLSPNMYMRLYELMNEGADIAECGYAIVHDDFFPLDDGTIEQVCYYTPQEAMKLHIRDEKFHQTIWNKLYRRDVIRDILFPVGNLIDDEFWTYRVLGNASRLAHSSCCMYAYRQQTDSVMHKPFSLKRLQGLDAKCQRMEYIRNRMPVLEEEAKYDLFLSCIFTMQSCLEFLNSEELETAKKKIYSVVQSVTPLPSKEDYTVLRNLLLKSAQVSFDGTCRLLNFLKKIHVLT